MMTIRRLLCDGSSQKAFPSAPLAVPRRGGAVVAKHLPQGEAVAVLLAVAAEGVGEGRSDKFAV